MALRQLYIFLLFQRRDAFIRQNLMYPDGPRAERINVQLQLSTFLKLYKYSGYYSLHNFNTINMIVCTTSMTEML